MDKYVELQASVCRKAVEKFGYQLNQGVLMNVAIAYQ